MELDPNGEGFVHTQDLLHAFHSQCEDWSINTMMHSILLELIPYAYLLAKVMNYRAFEEYYVQLFKHLLSQIAIEFKIPPEIHEKFVGAIHIPKPCWSLNNVIAHIICERTTPETMESIPKFISKSSVRLLTILAVGRKFIGMGTNIDMDCERWLGKDWKRRIGLSGDILKSFRRIMNGKSSNSAGRASQLIELFEIGSITIDFMVLAVKVLMLKFQTDAFAGAQSIEPKKCIYATADEMISIAHLRWKNDIRMHNVQLMLNSSRPILIATNILYVYFLTDLPGKHLEVPMDLKVQVLKKRTEKYEFLNRNFRTELPKLLGTGTLSVEFSDFFGFSIFRFCSKKKLEKKISAAPLVVSDRNYDFLF